MTTAITGQHQVQVMSSADSLGGSTLNIIQQGYYTGSPEQRLDLIRGLCERAAVHALKVSVEFLPWSAIGSLTRAQELVATVDHPNFGLNIDTWHHFRSGGTAPRQQYARRNQRDQKILNHS